MDIKTFKKKFPCDKTLAEIEKKIEKFEKSIKVLQELKQTVYLTKERCN